MARVANGGMDFHVYDMESEKLTNWLSDDSPIDKFTFCSRFFIVVGGRSSGGRPNSTNNEKLKHW